MFTRHSLHARKVSKWLYYGKLHLEEEGKNERKKERNIQKNKKLKLNKQRKHCEKILEVLLLY